MKSGSVVIFESTVYPGTTEEECVPKLSAVSQLKYKKDFHVGYSPERINPGDKSNTFSSIKKLTSGCDDKTLEFVDMLYNLVITAGTHKCSSIKVAEASKALENIQRDVNIGLMNEVTQIFDALKIPVHEVLKACSSKWNFLNFEPGLVGGHCIGIDPYYLAHKAIEMEASPDIILAARKCNDGMSNFLVEKIIDEILIKKCIPSDFKILLIGYAFKENCSDFRNTRVYDLAQLLSEKNINVDIYDPIIDIKNAKLTAKNINFIEVIRNNFYDLGVLTVPHDIFLNDQASMINNSIKNNGALFDIKNKWKYSSNLKILKL